MAFIQIIEMRTSKIDELTALEDEWRKATEGKRTLRRAVVGQDRNDPTPPSDRRVLRFVRVGDGELEPARDDRVR